MLSQPCLVSDQQVVVGSVSVLGSQETRDEVATSAAMRQGGPNHSLIVYHSHI